jgi:hypothetical protein
MVISPIGSRCDWLSAGGLLHDQSTSQTHHQFVSIMLSRVVKRFVWNCERAHYLLPMLCWLATGRKHTRIHIQTHTPAPLSKALANSESARANQIIIFCYLSFPYKLTRVCRTPWKLSLRLILSNHMRIPHYLKLISKHLFSNFMIDTRGLNILV